MIIMTSLLLSLVHFILLALDIICFFVIIRMLNRKVDRVWLKTFDSVGGPLVDLYISYLQKVINRISSKTFSQAALLNIAMLTLVIARIFIVALFSK
jgi:hypothetical protein